MTRYYIKSNNEYGLEELTETEFFRIVGNKVHSPYATKVYQGDITIDEVPEEYQSAVKDIVAARIEKFGEYSEREVSGEELKSMIEEAV